MKTISVAISQFVRRQTPASQFSHWHLSDEKLIGLVQENHAQSKPGYRDGVLLVPVPPEGFYSNVVALQEGDIIVGTFEARQPGEEPRKQTFALGGKKVPASRVDVVLYRHDVLAENDEQSSDADWEIISVNAEPADQGNPAPMSVGTLLANHFQQSGGTATHMDATALEAALRASSDYWKNKSHAAPYDLIQAPSGIDPNSDLSRAIHTLNNVYKAFVGACHEYRLARDNHHKMSQKL